MLKYLILSFLFAIVLSNKFGKNTETHFLTHKTGDVIITLKDHVNIESLFQGKSLSIDEKAELLVHSLIKKSIQSQKTLLSDIIAKNNYNFQVLWIINGLLVKGVDFSFVQSVASRDDVDFITIDEPYKIEEIEEKSKMEVQNVSMAQDVIEYNVAWVKAPEVWKMGYTGKGIVVGVGDTGLYYQHEAIVNSYAGNLGGGRFDHNYNWHDPNGRAEPYDSNGHGTHCSGTIAGGKGVNRKIGVAPDAKLTHCLALASIAAQIICMQWFLAPTDVRNQNPNPSKRPHIISQSYNNWSCSPGCDPNYKRATEALVAAGVAVINSAGNRGSGCSTINPNARFPGQLSIASLRKDSNLVSSFSSRGPNALDRNILKPDISAPGENVVSAARTGNGYVSMSGTSMSTPNVAGGVALLWSAVPQLVRNIPLTNRILQQSSLQQVSQVCDPKGTPNGEYGYGTVDYEKAVKLAQQMFSKN